MSDIQKIQLIHDVKSTFSVDDAQMQQLINQIEDKDKKENIDRFFGGYKIEDEFLYLGAALPWVRCIHALNQAQHPQSSKSEFQVPDYFVIFENYSRKCFPILIDVKQAKGNKQNLELMSDQAQLCAEYAAIHSSPVVYAIYWENWKIWTINTKDQFKIKSKKLSINIADAVKNDVSAIFGNVNYFVPILYRKTECSSDTSVDNNDAVHQDYGSIIHDSISKDNISFTPLLQIESFILDSFADMKKLSVIKNGSLTTLSECTKSVYFFNLTSLICLCLANMEDVIAKDKYRNVMVLIIDFMKKFGFGHSHKIPNQHSEMAFNLFKTSFSETSVFESYKSNHGV